MKKPSKQWLWLLATVVILGLIAWNLSQSGEWRNFRWELLWVSLVSARPGYLLAALAMTYSSYVVRAYRWGFFLEPVKRASFRVLFVGQVLGFSAIYLVGRPGEVVRPGYIAKRENVSYTAMAAVWLLERIYDTVLIVIIFSIALYWGPMAAFSKARAADFARVRWAGLGILLVTALTVVFLVLLRLYTEPVKAALGKVCGFLPARARQKLEHFVTSFAEGLGVIRSWKELGGSIASTVILWFVNIAFYWLVLHSMPDPISRLDWLSSVILLFSAIMGMMVQLPGIGGGFQLVLIKVLTGVFGIGVEAATGAAILLWVMLIVPCVALGLVLLVHEGLTFKKLETIAEEERSVLEHKP